MKTAIDKLAETIHMPVETINNAVNFLGSLVKPTLEEMSLIPFDRVKEYRYKRQIDILNRTKCYCDKNNINLKTISLKNLVPLLEYSSLEEDEDMFNLWTSILIEAVDEKKDDYSINMYIDILRKLNAIDAKVLDCIYRYEIKENGAPISFNEIKIEIFKNDNKYNELIEKSISNLIRLDLIYDISKDLNNEILRDILCEICDGVENIDIEESYYLASTKTVVKGVSDEVKNKVNKFNLGNKTNIFFLTNMGKDFLKVCNKKV